MHTLHLSRLRSTPLWHRSNIPTASTFAEGMNQNTLYGSCTYPLTWLNLCAARSLHRAGFSRSVLESPQSPSPLLSPPSTPNLVSNTPCYCQAAHCGANLNGRRVQLGVQSLSDDDNNCVETFNIIQTIRHPDYNATSQKNDISLIQVIPF